VLIELVCDSAGGTLYWSCPQLEEGSTANRYNMAVNNDFTETVINSARVFPAYWTSCGNGMGSAYAHGIVSDRSESLLPESISGNAMRLISAPDRTNVTIGQELRAKGTRDDIFLVGGWCNAVSVSSGFQDYEASVSVRFMGSSGSWGAWRHVKFSVQRSGWHYVCK